MLHIGSGAVAEATQVLGWASTLRPFRFDPHSERTLPAQCAPAPAFCHPQRVAPPHGPPPRPSSTPVCGDLHLRDVTRWSWDDCRCNYRRFRHQISPRHEERLIGVLRSQCAFVRLRTVAHRVQPWRCGHCELGRLPWPAERSVTALVHQEPSAAKLLHNTTFCSSRQQTGSWAQPISGR